MKKFNLQQTIDIYNLVYFTVVPNLIKIIETLFSVEDEALKDWEHVSNPAYLYKAMKP